MSRLFRVLVHVLVVGLLPAVPSGAVPRKKAPAVKAIAAPITSVHGPGTMLHLPMVNPSDRIHEGFGDQPA